MEMRLDALARDLAKQAEQRPDESSHIAVMYATPGNMLPDPAMMMMMMVSLPSSWYWWCAWYWHVLVRYTAPGTMLPDPAIALVLVHRGVVRGTVTRPHQTTYWCIEEYNMAVIAHCPGRYV